MHVTFSYHNDDPTNIRNVADNGGGALYDIGCYAVVAARWFMDADPVRVAAVADTDPAFGTDWLTSALLDFGVPGFARRNWMGVRRTHRRHPTPSGPCADRHTEVGARQDADDRQLDSHALAPARTRLAGSSPSGGRVRAVGVQS